MKKERKSVNSLIKVLGLLIFINLCSFSLFAQGINFEHGNLADAIAKAKKENKLVFMDCYTDWCGPCKWLSKEVFPKKEVGDFFNKYFVSIKMDMEKGEGIALCKKYGVKSFPTLLFLDTNGKIVHKMVGGKPPKEFIEGAKGAINPELSFNSLSAKYENGNREYGFLISYFKAVKNLYDKKKMAEVANILFEKYSFDKFLTKDLFYIVENAGIKYNSEYFSIILKNKEELTNKVEAKALDQVVEGALRDYLQEFASICKSEDELYKEIDRCNKIQAIQQLDRLKNSLRYNYYIASGQLNKWFDERMKEAELLKGQQNYVYFIHATGDLALRVPKLSASKEIIKRTLKMGLDLAAMNDGLIMGNLLLAKVYLKLKDKENAFKCFNLFFENNAKAGGNNTHPSVSNLKKRIENL